MNIIAFLNRVTFSGITLSFLAASIAILFLAHQAPPANAAEELTCDFCASRISGQYYTIRDRNDGSSGQKTICLKCYESRPRCDLCRGVMREGTNFQGMNLCQSCMANVRNSPRCTACGNYITGSYVRYRDPESGQEICVCQKCNDARPKCEGCRGLMLQEYSLQGMKVCKSCFERIRKSPRCAICQNYIMGEYMRYEDKKTGLETTVCQKCGGTAEKCFVCGVPSNNLNDTQGKRVCGACLQRAGKCHGCGNYILKVGYNYDVAEQSYCAECEKTTPKCDVCGLPSGPSPVRLSDCRIICPDCEGTAVKDVATVRALYDAVAAFLVREYGMEIGHVSEISFKELPELAELGKDAPTAEKNVIPLGLFSRKGDKVDIFVQNNLPRNLLTGVIAHEYAHAYMYEKSPEFKDTEITEGFAEWIRYKTLMRLNDEKGAKLITLRKDIYGSGFQKVVDVEKAAGLQGVFDLFIKKN